MLLLLFFEEEEGEEERKIPLASLARRNIFFYGVCVRERVYARVKMESGEFFLVFVVQKRRVFFPTKAKKFFFIFPHKGVVIQKKNNMYLMYYLNEDGKRVYTLKVRLFLLLAFD